MPLFNVVQSCVVNGLHYVHPTTQPIEVDDEQAAELLAAGALEPYPKRADVFEGLNRTEADLGGDFLGDVDDVVPEPEVPKRTRRSRTED